MVFLLALFIVPVMYEEELEDIVRKEIDEKVDAHVAFDHLTVSMIRNFPDITLSVHGLTIKGKKDFEKDPPASIKVLPLHLL